MDPELNAAAEQFGRDMVAENVSGLINAMTPSGMSNGLALQAQRQATGQSLKATGFEHRYMAQQGDDHLIDLVLTSEAGEGVIETRWRNVFGLWKVDGMVLKSTSS